MFDIFQTILYYYVTASANLIFLWSVISYMNKKVYYTIVSILTVAPAKSPEILGLKVL